MAISVLARRWPVGGVGGESVTTVGVEFQALGSTIGAEPLHIKFDSYGLTPFTFDEMEGFISAFLPFIEGKGQFGSVDHQFSGRLKIAFCEPNNSDTVCSAEFTHKTSI
jgi:hypothetical protein